MELEWNQKRIRTGQGQEYILNDSRCSVSPSIADKSPVHGPCVSGVQTQALGPAQSGIRHHEPRVTVYPVNTPAVEKWLE